MTTINIHKDKLLPAAFAYQQRKLKANANVLQGVHTNDYDMLMWLSETNSRVQREYKLLQTACRVAEDGIVSLDIDVVQRLFGEE